MSAKVSTKTILTLAAVAAFGAAALAPSSASAFSRAPSSMHMMVKARSDDQKWSGYCGYPPCPHPNPIFVRPGNRASTVFGN
jgi:hypothetical protein